MLVSGLFVYFVLYQNLCALAPIKSRTTSRSDASGSCCLGRPSEDIRAFESGPVLIISS